MRPTRLPSRTFGNAELSLSTPDSTCACALTWDTDETANTDTAASCDKNLCINIDLGPVVGRPARFCARPHHSELFRRATEKTAVHIVGRITYAGTSLAPVCGCEIGLSPDLRPFPSHTPFDRGRGVPQPRRIAVRRFVVSTTPH